MVAVVVVVLAVAWWLVLQANGSMQALVTSLRTRACRHLATIGGIEKVRAKYRLMLEEATEEKEKFRKLLRRSPVDGSQDWHLAKLGV